MTLAFLDIFLGGCTAVFGIMLLASVIWPPEPHFDDTPRPINLVVGLIAACTGVRLALHGLGYA